MTNQLTLDKNNIWIDNELNQLSYPEEGNDASFMVEEKSFWFRQRNEVIKQVIQRFPFKGNYADIGGGNGYQAKYIADNFNAEVFLIEPGYNGCLNAKKRGLKDVYNVGFQKFDFAKNNVTAVGLYDVIEHIEKDVQFLQELKNCLPKESLIYITVPSYMFLWSDMDQYGGHYRRYNNKMIKKLAGDAGLQVVYSSFFFSYLTPITFFLRSLPFRFRKKRPSETILSDATAQHQPSPLTTSVFDFFNRLELSFIRKRSLPLGASLITVLKVNE